MMSKKVIWVINQTAGKPDSGWGERHFYFANYWVQKGYVVKIISGSYNHLFKKQIETTRHLFTYENVAENIDFCWVKTPKYYDGGWRKFWSNFIFMCKLLFLTDKKLEKPTVILVSSMPIFPILNGYLLKQRYKANKLLIEIRDLWPLTPIYLKGYSTKHPLVKIVGWFEKFAYQKSDAIVSLLPNAHTYINSISKDASKFNWIPNGIDERLLESEVLSTEILNEIPTHKFIIGYTGTMGMANALEYFVEASILMKNNPLVHFVLVGDGYLKPALQQQTKLNTNISFISKINKNQVQQVLKLFSVCFIGRNDTPLFDYGVSSNKYFDYMLAGKPVLESSNFIDSPAQLSECGITVKPENAQAIVDGILKFQEMTVDELNNFGEKGCSYVKKYHNFEYLSEKYLKLF